MKIQILLILLILLILSVFSYAGYEGWLASIGIAPKEIILDYKTASTSSRAGAEKTIPNEEGVFKEKEKIEDLSYPVRDYRNEPEAPIEQISNRVFLSSDRLEQGDTLIIRIKNELGIDKVSGEFGSEKINFFKPKTEENWVAIVGIDAKKEPGKYNLNINFLDNNFKKEIDIVKRKFPITELLVTEELKEKGYSPEKIEKNIATKENPKLYEVLQVFTPTAYFNQSFIYPLQKIQLVGAFGNIRRSSDISLQHLGVDLEAEVGNSVYATNDGVVCFSEDLNTFGKTLIINHGLGIYSLYLHLSEFKVSNGERVKRGNIIGLSGNTGYSIAPHLHFSVKVNGSSIDPLRFIETTEKEMTR